MFQELGIQNQLNHNHYPQRIEKIPEGNNRFMNSSVVIIKNNLSESLEV